MEPLPPVSELLPFVGGIAGAVIAHFAGFALWQGALGGIAVGLVAYELARRSRTRLGRRFVGGWEYNARANRARRAGDLQAAAAALREGVEAHPRNALLRYNLACHESLAGERSSALDHLAQAIYRDPRFARIAASDRDLDAIRDDPRFPRLSGSGETARAL
jgi:tetratricopeptide (TPR) repeat protein